MEHGKDLDGGSEKLRIGNECGSVLRSAPEEADDS
jgi:hypothetical protein